MARTLQDVIDQMTLFGITGLQACDLKADGKKHPFALRGKRKKSAWYRLFEHTTRRGARVYVGAFGVGDESNWARVEPSEADLDTAERAELARAQKQRDKEAAQSRKNEAEAAAAKAQRLWERAHEEGANAYLDAKGVRAFGVRFLRATLLVPVRDVHGALHGCQYILPEGEGFAKTFNTGMAKTGHFHLVGAVRDGAPLLFAEGYATAASLHMATAWPVVVSFDAGNMEAVAAALRPLYPELQFVFAGDDDRHLRRRLRQRLAALDVPGEIEPDGSVHVFHQQAGELRVSAAVEAADGIQAIALTIQRQDGKRHRHLIQNAGRKAAVACARRFKGVAVFPAFAAADAAGTDWNDLHQAEGLGVLRSQVLAGMQSARHAQRAKASGSGPPGGRGGSAGPPADDDDWRSRLVWKRGELVACLANVHDILVREALWEGVLAFDEFAQRTMKRKPPPIDGGRAGEWEAVDDSQTAMWISRRYGMAPSSALVAEAVEVVARGASYHPVRDWLRGLKWDGTARLDEWMEDAFGVPRTPYSMRVSRWYPMGMVARVMRPGVKFDYCLVLESPQGRMKSSALRVLGGEWYGDTDIDLNNKDAMSALRGKWLYEFPELGALGRAEERKQKSFLSRQVDEFRPVYGRREIRCPRQIVFAGTTNEWEWNKDPTGGRRFWPIAVMVDEIDLAALAELRDQLFAEALVAFEKGERYWPTAQEQRELFDPEQLKREQQESLVDALHDWVYSRIGDFSIADAVLEGLKMDAGKLTRDLATRVGIAVRKLGCTRVEKRNGMTRYWYRPPQRDQASRPAQLGSGSHEREVPF